jgi:hypothetical protein
LAASRVDRLAFDVGPAATERTNAEGPARAPQMDALRSVYKTHRVEN